MKKVTAMMTITMTWRTYCAKYACRMLNVSELFYDSRRRITPQAWAQGTPHPPQYTPTPPPATAFRPPSAALLHRRSSPPPHSSRHSPSAAPIIHPALNRCRSIPGRDTTKAKPKPASPAPSVAKMPSRRLSSTPRSSPPPLSACSAAALRALGRLPSPPRSGLLSRRSRSPPTPAKVPPPSHPALPFRHSARPAPSNYITI